MPGASRPQKKNSPAPSRPRAAAVPARSPSSPPSTHAARSPSGRARCPRRSARAPPPRGPSPLSSTRSPCKLATENPLSSPLIVTEHCVHVPLRPRLAPRAVLALACGLRAALLITHLPRLLRPARRFVQRAQPRLRLTHLSAPWRLSDRSREGSSPAWCHRRASL